MTDNNKNDSYTAATRDMMSGSRPTLTGAVCKCPRCNIHAFSVSEAQVIFGYRNMKRLDSAGNVKRIERKVQSHCRKCRKAERIAKAAGLK